MSYFDTNTSSHHHFYDEETKELIDINSQEVEIKKHQHLQMEKKLKDVEVTFKISKKLVYNHSKLLDIFLFRFIYFQISGGNYEQRNKQ